MPDPLLPFRFEVETDAGARYPCSSVVVSYLPSGTVRVVLRALACGGGGGLDQIMGQPGSVALTIRVLTAAGTAGRVWRVAAADMLAYRLGPPLGPGQLPAPGVSLELCTSACAPAEEVAVFTAPAVEILQLPDLGAFVWPQPVAEDPTAEDPPT